MDRNISIDNLSFRYPLARIKKRAQKMLPLFLSELVCFSACCIGITVSAENSNQSLHSLEDQVVVAALPKGAKWKSVSPAELSPARLYTVASLA